MRWFLTRHALDRAAEMGLTRADVLPVLDDPEVDYVSKDGRRVAQRDGLAVVYQADRVITVLHRRQDQWDRTTIRQQEPPVAPR